MGGVRVVQAPDGRNAAGFEPGDVVEFDHPAYARFSRGDSAMAELAARRKPRIVGQVVSVSTSTVEVIWEDGRLGIFAFDPSRCVPRWTPTTVLKQL